jgi:hypothetical protein
MKTLGKILYWYGISLMGLGALVLLIDKFAESYTNHGWAGVAAGMLVLSVPASIGLGFWILGRHRP